MMASTSKSLPNSPPEDGAKRSKEGELEAGTLVRMMRGFKFTHEVPVLHLLQYQGTSLDPNRLRLTVSDGKYVTNNVFAATILNRAVRSYMPFSYINVYEFEAIKVHGGIVLQIYKMSQVEYSSREPDERLEVIDTKDLIVSIYPGYFDPKLIKPGDLSDENISGDDECLKDEMGIGTTKDGKKRTAPLVMPDYLKFGKPAKLVKDTKLEEVAAPQVNVEPITFEEKDLTRIANLRLGNKNLAIKARVTAKSSMKSFMRGSSARQFFDAKLDDGSGTLRLLVYQDDFNKFLNLIQVNNSYYFKNFTVSNATKWSGDAKFEFNVTKTSMIVPCDKDFKVDPANLAKENFIVSSDNPPPALIEVSTTYKTAKREYCTVSFKELNTLPVGSTVDVIGVINKINDMTEIQRRDGVVVKKRMFNINDHELKNIRVTAWGANAEAFPAGKSKSVILMKGAQLGYYEGKVELRMPPLYLIEIDPQLQQV